MEPSLRSAAITDPSMRPILDWIDSYVSWEKLPEETRHDLATRAHAGDTAALEMMVCHNLRLVLSRAVKRLGRGVPLNDLVQEGWIGLRTAAGRFDPARKTRTTGQPVKFSSVATHWIDRALRNAIIEQGRTIRLPHHADEFLTRMRMRLFTGEPIRLDDQTQLDGLARELTGNPHLRNVTLDYVEQVMHGPVSLDKPIAHISRGGVETEHTLTDILPAPMQHDTSDSLDIEQILVKMVNLGILSRRDGWLIVRHYGLDGDGGRSYTQMARELAEAASKAGDPEGAVSRQRIEQLISTAQRKIRRYSQAHGHYQVAVREVAQNDEQGDLIDLEALDLKALLPEMVNNGSLNQRYARVLTLYFGLVDNRKPTYTEIARQLHMEAVQSGAANAESQPVSRFVIRNIIQVAMRKLRQYVLTHSGQLGDTMPAIVYSKEQAKGSRVPLSPAKVKSTESPKNRSTRHTSVNDSLDETAASRVAAPTPLRAKSSTKRTKRSSQHSQVSGVDVPYAEAI